MNRRRKQRRVLLLPSLPLYEGVAPPASLVEGATQAPLIANFCRCISHYQVIEAVMSVAGKGR
jgi:hypothetical protein